jgi:hypothetical protein
MVTIPDRVHQGDILRKSTLSGIILGGLWISPMNLNPSDPKVRTLQQSLHALADAITQLARVCSPKEEDAGV